MMVEHTDAEAAKVLQLILDTVPPIEDVQARSGNATAAREKRIRAAVGDRLRSLRNPS